MAVPPAWEAYRDRLLDNVRSVSESLVDQVDELTGVMRIASPDDYWTYNTSVAGPLAELVASLGSGRVRAVRSTVGATGQGGATSR